jgi:type I restriction enzyme S subunit
MGTVKENFNVQKYPYYRDSGAEWMGDIPDNWDSIKMKHLFQDVSIKKKADAELLSVTQNQGVVPRIWVENRMVMPSGALESFKFINKGDFAISLRSFEGGLEYCHHDGIISPAYTVLKAKRIFESQFYKYLFKSFSFISELQTSVVGIRQGKNISFEELSYSYLPIPPLAEQTAIAEFLDRKTALIDKAIDIKLKQIELLKERRQILIHKAVTRGLNPNVKMKESGVEWIGEIPEHWKMKKNGNLARIIRGASPRPAGHPMYFNGTDIPWIAVGDITRDEDIYITTPVNFLTLAGKKQSRFIENGTFVLSNSGATLGVPKIMNLSGCINDGVLAFLDLKEYLVDKIFLYYYFSSQTLRLRDEMNQGATQPNLNTSIVKQLAIALPSIKEQIEIVDYAKELTNKIATAISLKEKEIEKLKEYKATLINSAVTGKIKVYNDAK